MKKKLNLNFKSDKELLHQIDFTDFACSAFNGITKELRVCRVELQETERACCP